MPTLSSHVRTTLLLVLRTWLEWEQYKWVVCYGTWCVKKGISLWYLSLYIYTYIYMYIYIYIRAGDNIWYIMHLTECSYLVLQPEYCIVGNRCTPQYYDQRWHFGVGISASWFWGAFCWGTCKIAIHIYPCVWIKTWPSFAEQLCREPISIKNGTCCCCCTCSGD